MEGNIMDDNVKTLYELSWRYRAARVLHVANAVDIFTALSEKEMLLEELCQQCRTEPRITEKLLIACTAMGLLDKCGGRYRNTELAETYLVRGRRLYQGDIVAHSATVWDFWTTLEDKVRTAAEPKNKHADENRNFVLGMHNIAAVGRAQMFLDKVELSGRRRLLDVGGGPGTYSILACKRYPSLRAVVFDLPETVSIAREIIANEGMQDRVSVQEGDWGKDDFGEGYDVVLLFNVLHGPDDNAEMKLRKAYDSMEHGGLLVIQGFLLNNERTGPLGSALFNLMVGVYSRSELLSIIKETGFAQAVVVAASQEIGIAWIIAEKP
ncbi:MAG: methyltransferase [Planctomycetota bacterium]|jgi:SAM-dependent methyltransferase